jgi:hypothetical protein
VKDITEKNFGVVIAFLLPGFLFLWGLSYSVDEIAIWLAKSSINNTPTVGGFLYATLASLALGMLLSAIRWLIVDSLFSVTGIKTPDLDFGKLKEGDNYSVFLGVVENHYRYYQCYSNTLVAILSALSIHLIFGEEKLSFAVCMISGAVVITLFFSSRDALKKYNERAISIFSE